jgi:hypothetical protein
MNLLKRCITAGKIVFMKQQRKHWEKKRLTEEGKQVFERRSTKRRAK